MGNLKQTSLWPFHFDCSSWRAVLLDELLYAVTPCFVALLKAVDVGVPELKVNGGFSFVDSLFHASHESPAPQELKVSTLLGCCRELEKGFEVIRAGTLYEEGEIDGGDGGNRWLGAILHDGGK
jgi:hypothetical protein